MCKCCLTVQEHSGSSWKKDGSLAGAFRLLRVVFLLILSALGSQSPGSKHQQGSEEPEFSLTVQGPTGYVQRKLLRVQTCGGF